MTAEVYWIRASHHSDVTLDGYVGVSKDAKKRWSYGHNSAYKRGRHDNSKFSNAITKYGWDNLIKTVLVVADEDYCYDLERKLRPTDSIGWNLVMGGGKPPVAKFRGEDYVSPLKGVSRSTPWMIGRKPANTGVPASEETRAKLSAAAKGRKNTPEHLAKRMESRRLTRIAKGQIRPFVVNGIQYESSKTASEALEIPEPTLKYWAYGKGKPSKAYSHITEVRWVDADIS
jgi:hypothetical protein